MSTASQKSPSLVAVTTRFVPAESFAVRVQVGFLARTARSLRIRQISAPSWGKTFLPVATLPPVGTHEPKGSSVQQNTFMKTLTVETSKGTKTYTLSQTPQGYDVQKVTGFFGSKKLVGHGSNVENAVLVARVDAGDSIVRSTKLRG
jgi:hypothetical protein